MADLIQITKTDLLEVTRQRIDIISQSGKQGPPGIQGPPGPPGGSTMPFTAGTAIGGHRAVVVNSDGKLEYASADVLNHMNRVVGITVGAAEANAECHVQSSVQMTESTWNWDVNIPVYLGLDGVLTQNVPSYPEYKFSLVLGFPVTSTSIFINIREPIILSNQES